MSDSQLAAYNRAPQQVNSVADSQGRIRLYFADNNNKIKTYDTFVDCWDDIVNGDNNRVSETQQDSFTQIAGEKAFTAGVKLVQYFEESF